MAYRLSPNNVCSIAKTAIQQAKETIIESQSNLLRPCSRDVRYIQDSHGDLIQNEERSKHLNKDFPSRTGPKIPFSNNRQSRNVTERNLASKVLRQRSISHECPRTVLACTDIVKFSTEKLVANSVEVGNSISSHRLNNRAREVDTGSFKYINKLRCLSYSDILRENEKRQTNWYQNSGCIKGEGEKTQSCDSFKRKYSDDSSSKDLQPKYPMFSKFKGVAPIKPDAPRLDPEQEDDCIRKKCNIPKDDLTGTCDNPAPKRTWLRAINWKSGPCPPKTPVCADPKCSGFVKECETETSESCPPSFSPKCPSPPPCPPPFAPPCPSPCPTTFSPTSLPSCPPAFAPPCPPPCPPPCCRPCPPPCPSPCPAPVMPPRKFRNPCQKVSFWEKIKNYFKARPNCPTPAQAKKKKMMKKVRKMADKAGLGVYDPCDDPMMICKEVERRCCLARRKSCTNKRCYHSFGSPRSHLIERYSLGFLSVNNRTFLETHYMSLFQIPWFRTIRNWRNPFEFYEIEETDETAQNKSLLKAEKFQSSRDIVVILNALQAIDSDVLKDMMCRSLEIQSSRDDDFRVQMNYLIEFNPECLEKKKDILMEILLVISKEIRSRKNNELEEIDTGDVSSELLKKLVNIKNRR